MGKLTALPTRKPDKGAMLAALNDLKRRIEDGKVIGFAAVGIEPDDTTRMWCGTSVSVSRLRMIGALSTATMRFESGEVA